MRIIADEQIPLVEELLRPHAEIQRLPAEKITAENIKNADILWVRSVTPVNSLLLKNNHVQWVGTASAGIDHLDISWLSHHNITWADAKGSNATAVCEYIISCIAYLKTQKLLEKSSLRAGIIGVGHVGERVLDALNTLGFEVLVNDPLRAEKDPSFHSIPLTEFTDLDLLTIHTPLTRETQYPTYHLINEAFLKRQKPNCVFINTARGGVADSEALYNANHLILCLDVWENEPAIRRDLLEKSLIATPHVAGYTKEAKYRASIILYEKMRPFFNLPPLNTTLQSQLFSPFLSTIDTRTLTSWEETVLAAYNPAIDTQSLKSSGDFYSLRKNYAHRNEFGSITLKNIQLSDNEKKLLAQLGFKL